MGLNLKLPTNLSTGDVSEIEMVEEIIDDLVLKITSRSESLQPVAFAFGASVADGSFGGGETAPNLSLHYSKAHEVTWKTLMGVKEDLLNFQDICRKAKEEILNADQSSADQMTAVAGLFETAPETIDRNSQEAHDRARNEAGNRGEDR